MCSFCRGQEISTFPQRTQNETNIRSRTRITCKNTRENYNRGNLQELSFARDRMKTLVENG